MKKKLKKENRESFLKRFKGKLSKKDLEDIDFAYDLAKEAHRPAKRVGSGERYFEHPRSGVLIMTDELGLYNRDLIISFLLHDVGEDTPMFGNITKSYDEFRNKATLRLNKLFNKKVADNVIRLSRPSVENIKFKNKTETYNFYLKELKKSEDAILLKMIDRLHNLRSLFGTSSEFKRKQVEETKSKYIKIFESVSGKNKKYTQILLKKIKKELKKLKEGSSS